MSTASKTLAIKARVYNQIRKDLYNTSKEPTKWGVTKNLLTDKDKLELFNKWFDLNKEAHTELNNYKAKRKEKKAVDAYRKTSGYYEKKAAKKEKSESHKQAKIKAYLDSGKLQEQLANAI